MGPETVLLARRHPGMYPWKLNAVVSGKTIRRSLPSASKRQSSTASAPSANTEKFVPEPSQTRTQWICRSRPNLAHSSSVRLLGSAKKYFSGSVIRCLAQDQISPSPRGQNILEEVLLVDCLPDASRSLVGFYVGEVAITAEEASGVLEGSFSQGEEALDIPLLDVGGVSVHVDREVKVVTDKDGRFQVCGPGLAAR